MADAPTGNDRTDGLADDLRRLRSPVIGTRTDHNAWIQWHFAHILIVATPKAVSYYTVRISGAPSSLKVLPNAEIAALKRASGELAKFINDSESPKLCPTIDLVGS